MRSALCRYIVLLTVFTVFAAAMMFKPSRANAGIYTLGPTDDTYADRLAPGNNYASLNYLVARKSIAPAQIYLKFPLDEIPAGEQIASATFGLYSSYGYRTWATLNHIPDDSWDQKQVTWNNPPGHGSQGIELDRQFLGSSYSWLLWDMFGNNLWDAAADQTDGYVSLSVVTLSSDLIFVSKEFFIDAQKPFLRITTTPVNTPIPHPLLLLGTGLLGLIGIRKRFG